MLDEVLMILAVLSLDAGEEWLRVTPTTTIAKKYEIKMKSNPNSHWQY